MKIMNSVNRIIQRVSGGRMGWELGGMPVLELTTIGRKSGQPRTTLLTSPVVLDDAWVVVASRGGDDTHPAWFLNLRDNPQVTVSVKGAKPREMTAHVASAAERAALWPRVTADHKNYAEYQEKTDREIPLVILAP
jgi:deazaflavin-dependent oxidoreductase (nitroreductase family)